MGTATTMPAAADLQQSSASTRRDLVVVAASAGGVEALRTLLSRMPAQLNGSIMMVLHRSPIYVGNCTGVIGATSPHVVHEPQDRELLAPGRIYLAPRDMHMTLEGPHIRVLRGPKEHFTRPAADPLFRSAARYYGSRVVGIVLTGGGHDGLSGLLAIKAAGGLSLVQDPEEAKADSMPRRAIADDDVDAVLPLAALAETLGGFLNGRAIASV